MPMQDYLDQELKKICPIEGVSFGKLEDKATWEIQFTKEATEEQKKAALELVDSFVWSPQKQEENRKDSRDKKYTDDLAIKSGYVIYLKENPDATLSQFLDYLESVGT